MYGLEPNSKDFVDAYLDYDRYDYQDVWQIIDGNLGSTYKDEPNSCAARISCGLNYGGEPIPAGVPGGNRNYGGDNQRYIVSAQQLRNYLEDRWGAPDAKLRNQSDLNTFRDSLVKGQAAIVMSREHAAVIVGGSSYADPYVDTFYGDAWLLPSED